MSSDETLQYLALALASGFKGYVDRRNDMADMQQRMGSQEDRSLRTNKLRAEVDSTRALQDERLARAAKLSGEEQSADEDPFNLELKNIPIAQRMGVVADYERLLGKDKNYDRALEDADRELQNVDQDFTVTPEPKLGETDTTSPEVRQAQMKAQREARAKRSFTLGLLHRMKGRATGGLGAQQAQPQMQDPRAQGVPGFKQFGELHSGDYGHPVGPELPPGGMASMGAGDPTGGARVTQPRMPTEQVAAQNYQAFASAPQPGANGEDQRRAGEVAELFTYINDPNSPFPTQAMAWFRLHDLIGIPIPQVFRTWATAQGVPRNIVDQYARQPQGQPGPATQPLQPMRK